MKAYPAHIWRKKNDTWSVEFPDLPGCFSFGSSLLEAKIKAEEALATYLESLDWGCGQNPGHESLSGGCSCTQGKIETELFALT